MKNSLKLSVAAVVFFLGEALIYTSTQMQGALLGGGVAAAIAYKFQWLMILTFAVAVFTPVAVWIEKSAAKPGLALISFGILVSFTMVGFTALSFVRFSKLPSAGRGPVPADVLKAAEPVVSDVLEYLDSKINLKDPETLTVDLEFRNLTNEEWTELDYTFVALREGQIFYRIKIRQAVYFPPKKISSVPLEWQRTQFKDTQLFDTMLEAYNKGVLRVYAKATRVKSISGKVVEEPLNPSEPETPK